MVLELRDDNLVAGCKVAAAVAVGDEVDGLRRTAREDDLVAVGRVDPRGHPLARGGKTGGGAGAEQVHAALDVCTLVGVGLDHAVDHGTGLLCGGGIVQVHQTMAVDGHL